MYTRCWLLIYQAPWKAGEAWCCPDHLAELVQLSKVLTELCLTPILVPPNFLDWSPICPAPHLAALNLKALNSQPRQPSTPEMRMLLPGEQNPACSELPCHTQSCILGLLGL
jgi:hypothetical protein